jgi:hypothetical protein
MWFLNKMQKKYDILNVHVLMQVYVSVFIEKFSNK